jgi:hypothetical protein
LKYFPRLTPLEDSQEARNIFIDERIAEEQIEEDTELFGDRPTPLDPCEVLNTPLDNSQNDQDRMMVDVNEDTDLFHVGRDTLAQSPVCANGNTSRDTSKPANLDDHVMVGEHSKISASSNNETPPTLETEVLEGDLSDSPASAVHSECSPLLAWLDGTIPPENATIVHRRRQERVDLQMEVYAHEVEEIEKLRNVVVIPPLYEAEKAALAESDSKEEPQMPFGARI